MQKRYKLDKDKLFKMKHKIYLLRHCPTSDNELGINGSRNDTPLSQNGAAMAAELAKNLIHYKFDVIIVSPLKRTFETIKPYLDLVKINPQVMIERLTNERDLGVFTNSKEDNGLIKRDIEISGKSRTEWKPESGESTAEVYERAKIFLERLKLISDENILICGHQNFLRCLELLLKGKPLNDENYYDYKPPRLTLGELREFSI